MSEHRRALLALSLAVAMAFSLLVFPIVHPYTTTVSGDTLYAGNAAPHVGNSPSVKLPMGPVIDDASDSDLTVHYDVSEEGVSASDLAIVLRDSDSGTVLDAKTTVGSTSGSATLTVAGNDVDGDFTAEVQVRDTATPSMLATDRAMVSVRRPGPADGVDVVDGTFVAGQTEYVDVGYNLTNTAAGNDMGNVEIALVHDGDSTDLDTIPPYSGQKGAVMLQFTRSETFSGTVEVRHGGSVVASDTVTFTAGGGAGGGGGGGGGGFNMNWVAPGCFGPDNGQPGACVQVENHIVEDGTAITFDGSNSDDDGSIRSYEWDLDSSGNTDATGQVVEHTYPGTGEYKAGLTVTDDEGNTHSVTVPINVQNTWQAGNGEATVTTTSIQNGSSNPADRTVTVDYDTGSFSGDVDIEIQAMQGRPAAKTTVPAGDSTATVTLPDFSTSSRPTFFLIVRDNHTGFHGGVDEELHFSTACVDLRDASGSTYFQCPEVTSASVETADGTAVSDVAVDASLGDFGLVDVKLHEAGNANGLDLSSPSVSDSIDADTNLWVNYTVKGALPGALMGRADVNSWETTNVTTGSTREYEVNVSLSPIEMYRNTSIGVSDPNRWPTDDGKATEVDGALVHFSMSDMSMLPSQARDDFQGATLTTDAQVYRPPRYSPGGNGQQGSLSMAVAGPHYETDGSTQNTGFYDAVIPSGMLDAWGVEATELTGSYQGQKIEELQVTELDNGNVQVRMDIHYSNGTITLSPNPSSNGGSSGGSAAEASDDSGGSENTVTSTPTATPRETTTPTPAATPETETPLATPTPSLTPEPAETSEPVPNTPTESKTTSGDGPGFGSVAAILAMAVALALLARRDQNGK